MYHTKFRAFAQEFVKHAEKNVFNSSSPFAKVSTFILSAVAANRIFLHRGEKYSANKGKKIPFKLFVA